jgi:hypothetical protein
VKKVDYTFGCLLVIASFMHAYGSFHSYSKAPVTLVWALSGALAGILVAILNLLRVGRPDDHALAWASLGASIGWMIVAISFGAASGNALDPRPMTHVVITILLIVMSVLTLRRQKLSNLTNEERS